MHKPTCVIVDSDISRRMAYRKYLQGRFQVIESGGVKECAMHFESRRPTVLVASLNQGLGHGLELCRGLRELQGGAACVMVVHGRPQGATGDRALIEARWQVDAFIPYEMEADAIESLLIYELSARKRRELRAKMPQSTPADEAEYAPSQWHKLFDQKANMAVFKTLVEREIHLLPKPDAEKNIDELGMIDLLGSDVNSKVLKALMQKEFHLLPQSGGMSEQPSWADLLGSEANLKNLKTLMKKEVVPRTAYGKKIGDGAAPLQNIDAAPDPAMGASQNTVNPAREGEGATSWSELLKADVSVSNIGKLLRKEIIAR